ncbi:phage shock protein A (PspA) family protein [Melghiribacillus thermohalophilus]|uniref:Phage shock protein A (PspA) family protein n=1 Tax=Melghiribacillus thermohalophilus TaxID=1324956 RepID=A0A4R3N3C3_9BACI|nr:PspA/IM30 family protein [Melghiribacillus thermohalophilus]TCT23640.1 phage shock protein A (PspA) family protein [Melghiribacillus thermohalophilus]
MSSLLQRVKDTILADFHEILDQKEKENPIAHLNQYIRNCENEAKKIAKLVDRHRMLKNEFYRDWKHAEHMAKKRKEQSDIARQAEEFTLHELAEKEQRQYEERVAHLKTAYENTMKQLQELEEKYHDMKLKLKDIHTRRLELMGKENAVRIKNKISRILDDSYGGDTDLRFKDMEQYIENLDAHISNAYDRNTLDQRIEQLKANIKQ